ncbi:MAG: hypothetical protein IPJ88_04215 [Myxococcales bacterium]|nr:MAG: hypothetical protein IPJ88_04215 [Myxococcales bacterium]
MSRRRLHCLTPELEQLHNYLDACVSGQSLRKLQQKLREEIVAEHGAYRVLLEKMAAVVSAATAEEPEPELLIEGQEALFQHPEFKDAETLRAILRTLEGKTQLLELLNHTIAAQDVQVAIGTEMHVDSSKDLSVIYANYGVQGSTEGTVGVITPRRIDYGKIVPLVGYTAKVMSEILENNQ